ncbi:MAG: Rid family hydrolase [Planctomycetota bacterium]
MTERMRAFTGSPWEEIAGFARGTRVGDRVIVGGTVAVHPDGTTFAPNDAGAQAARCWEIIEEALKQLGVSRGAVLHSRAFLVDMSQADGVIAAHKAFFGDLKPCFTLLGCPALVREDLMIEIEVEAHAGG